MEITPNFPPKVEISDPDNGGSYWVEAFGVDIVQAMDQKQLKSLCMYVRIQGNRQRIFPSGTSSMPRDVIG